MKLSYTWVYISSLSNFQNPSISTDLSMTKKHLKDAQNGIPYSIKHLMTDLIHEMSLPKSNQLCFHKTILQPLLAALENIWLRYFKSNMSAIIQPGLPTVGPQPGEPPENERHRRGILRVSFGAHVFETLITQIRTCQRRQVLKHIMG